MTNEEQLRHYRENYEAAIRQEAARVIGQPMPELTEELFAIFETTGSRLEYDSAYTEKRSMLNAAALLALLEKRDTGHVSPATLEALTGFLRNTCDEICWALPAHTNRKNPDWNLCVDIMAAQTAQTLAELCDRLRDDLPHELCCRISHEVNRRVLEPFFSTEQYGWEKADHNWNAVCAGSIGSACLHLLREQPKLLEKRIQRICDSLIYYIEGFSDDGVCMEGQSYFNFGMAFFVNFAQELYEYTAGQTDLFRGEWQHFHAGAQDKRTRIAAFSTASFFCDGTTVSFSDGARNGKFAVGMACILKQHFSEMLLPDLQACADRLDCEWYRFVLRRMDLFAVQQYGSGEPSGCRILPAAQWCIADSRNKVGFACKGGHNQEPHNHNDLGHFLYESQGITFLADLGAGEYTRDYFNSRRYEILCNNSFSHSVPIVDGAGQGFGKEYRCTRFAAEASEQMLTTVMELADAYPSGKLRQFERTLRFSLVDGTLELLDSFVPGQEKCAITESLITQLPPQIRDGEIVLDGGSLSAHIQIANLHPEQDVQVMTFDHSNHDGLHEPVYAIRWQVPEHSPKAHVFIRIRKESGHA